MQGVVHKDDVSPEARAAVVEKQIVDWINNRHAVKVIDKYIHAHLIRHGMGQTLCGRDASGRRFTPSNMDAKCRTCVRIGVARAKRELYGVEEK